MGGRQAAPGGLARAPDHLAACGAGRYSLAMAGMQARPAALQRAAGSFTLAVAERDGGTRLARLGQAGCLRLLFPRAPGFEAVLLNTAGGIAAGDCHRGVVECGPGTTVMLTGQAAERCYRARPSEAAATVEVRLRLAVGSRLDWLPQELIVFDGAALDRSLHVDMAGDATLLCVESRILGRRHSGEQVASLRLSDRLCIRRDGATLLEDRLRIVGDARALLAGPAAAAAAIASASVVFVAPTAGARLDAVRAALAGETAGASAWNGMLVARLISHDAAGHRAALLRVLAVLREGALPAVWRC